MQTCNCVRARTRLPRGTKGTLQYQVVKYILTLEYLDLKMPYLAADDRRVFAAPKGLALDD